MVQTILLGTFLFRKVRNLLEWKLCGQAFCFVNYCIQVLRTVPDTKQVLNERLFNPVDGLYVMLSESLSCLLSFSYLIVIINRYDSNSHAYDSKFMLLKIKLDLLENFSCLESCLSHGNHKTQGNTECVQKMEKKQRKCPLYNLKYFFLFLFCSFSSTSLVFLKILSFATSWLRT